MIVVREPGLYWGLATSIVNSFHYYIVGFDSDQVVVYDESDLRGKVVEGNFLRGLSRHIGSRGDCVLGRFVKVLCLCKSEPSNIPCI